VNVAIYTICEQLLSATANGVYQGILVALIAGCALRLFPRLNATTRHAVWFGVLLFITALIPAHFYLATQSRTQNLAMSVQPKAIAPRDTEGIPLPYDSLEESRAGTSDDLPALPMETTANSDLRSTEIRPVWELSAAVHLPRWVCLGLASAWVLLAGFRGILVVRQIAEVRGAKKTSTAPSERLQTLFDRLRYSLASEREARLRISREHPTAMMLGFIRPVVLLPAEMDNPASDEETEQVLRHELAHVERRDDWGNLAQQIIEAALFFHPAVWWISSRLSLEREIACDDWVLDASARPRAYALTLANAASRMYQRRHMLAPGVSNSKNSSQLQKRITMILNTQRDRSPRLARRRLGIFTTVTALLALLAVVAGPRVVLAQTPKASPAPTTGTQTADAAPAEPQPGLPIASAPDAPDAPDAPPLPAPGAAAVPPMPERPLFSPKPKKNMSVEERLDRMERMLERLEAQGDKHRQQSLKHDFLPPPGDADSADAAAAYKQGMERFQQDMDKFKGPDGVRVAGLTTSLMKREAELTQRAIENSQHIVDQAVDEAANVSNQDLEQLQKTLQDLNSKWPDRELEALRAARDSLQKQVAEMEKQIKLLDEQKEALQKKLEKSKSDGSAPSQNTK
jgi:beta-lactamase regulating signal transducer with metallopeptidase domain